MHSTLNLQAEQGFMRVVDCWIREGDQKLCLLSILYWLFMLNPAPSSQNPKPKP